MANSKNKSAEQSAPVAPELVEPGDPKKGTILDPQRSDNGGPGTDDEKLSEQEARVVNEDAKEEARQATTSARIEENAERAAAAGGDAEKVEVSGYGRGRETIDDNPKDIQPTLEKDAAKAAADGVYIVQGSETLTDIATKFGIGVDRLAKINRLQTGYRSVTPGQEIKLR